MKLASRMSKLGTETAFEVLVKANALAATGVDVVHLELGEPDFDTPGHIIGAAKDALDGGFTHYGPAAGLPDVRAAVAKHTSETRGIDVSPDNVIVTPGAKPIMFYTLTALVEEGDEVIYPNPGFPIYESMIKFSGATPVPMRLYEEEGFKPDLDEVRRSITPRTRLIILNSPHNPTGGMMDKEDLETIAEMAKEHDILVLSDEMYRDIVYDSTHTSIAELPGMLEHSIILDGFSKTYAMTGWRLGYGVMNPGLAEAVAQLQTNCTSCTAAFIQMAGVEALTGPQDAVDGFVAEFQRRRDVIVDGLNSLEGVDSQRPAGAFYVFPQLSGFRISTDAIADRLLNEAGVAVLAGTAFGTVGADSLRLSFANSVENLERAVKRMRPVLAACR